MLKVGPVIVESLQNPVGIAEAPQFGWVLQSDKTDVLQTGYRLQIALDKEFSNVIFDSGDVQSDHSAYIEAPGLALQSSKRYFVRVCVQAAGEESGWSEPSFFVTALLNAYEWHAQFISAETADDAGNSKGTYVRKDFQLTGKVRFAVAYSTALGLYKFHINGHKVGDDELTPGWTSYHHHLLYQTYDVTELLHDGENAVSAILGAGWYKGWMGCERKRNIYGDRTAFLCRIEITLEDGSKTVVTTDSSWKGSDAPVLFSEIYDGETYDARLEQPGWDEPGFDDNGWRTVSEVNYDFSVFDAQPGCRVRQHERFEVKRLFVTPQGDTVLDFGQNMAGWIEFNVKGNVGDRVVLNCFETLDAQGNVYLANLRSAKETVTYTLNGQGTECFHPSFTFQGFRYARVTEYPGEPKAENFTAVAVYSDMRQTGRFHCSNELINGLEQNILWGLKSNFIDVPTDCPQRDERLGWTGDAEIFCGTASFLMDTSGFYGKWLRDVAADQTPNGGVPHVVPDILADRTGGDWLVSQGTHSAAAWADAAVIVPWTVYVAYGDRRVLERQYDSMKAWVDFMTAHADGPIWKFKLQFGDWVALDAQEGSYFGATPEDLICSAYYAYSTDLFAKTAAVLGREDDTRRYGELHEQIVEGFRKAFFNEDGSMTAHTQTSHIVALYFGLVPEEFREKTVETLLDLLREHDGHLVTGFVGTPYFLHALSRSGRVKEAYDLLLKEDFPSWLYQVKMGATTVWEHWDGIKPDGAMWSPDMNSFNHYAYGAVGEWLYRAVAGIVPDETAPGGRHIFIRPLVGGKLSFAQASLDTVYGTLAVSWELRGKNVELTVTVPHNATSTIELAQAKEILDPAGKFVKTGRGLSADIGSGKHVVNFTI